MDKELSGIPKIDYKIIELYTKGDSISNIVNTLEIEIEYVKKKIIARRVTDREEKENIYEQCLKNKTDFVDKLSEMYKEEEKKLNEE